MQLVLCTVDRHGYTIVVTTFTTSRSHAWYRSRLTVFKVGGAGGPRVVIRTGADFA